MHAASFAAKVLTFKKGTREMLQRAEVINYFITRFGYIRYLEIGVEAGVTFNLVNAEEKTAVDPHFKIARDLLRGESFEMTSDSHRLRLEIGSRTMKRQDVIQKLISFIGAKSYLEVGVNRGETFHAIQCRRKVAVKTAK